MIELPSRILTRSEIIEFRKNIRPFPPEWTESDIRSEGGDYVSVIDDMVSQGFSIQRAYQILMELILGVSNENIDYTQKDIISDIAESTITPTGVYLDDSFLDDIDPDEIEYRYDYFDITKELDEIELLPQTTILASIGSNIGQLTSIVEVSKNFQLDVSDKIASIQESMLDITRTISSRLTSVDSVDGNGSTPSFPIESIITSISDTLSPIKNVLTEAVTQKNIVDNLKTIIPEEDTLLSYIPDTSYLNAKINRTVTIALNQLQELHLNIQSDEYPTDEPVDGG